MEEGSQAPPEHNWILNNTNKGPLELYPSSVEQEE